MNFYADKQTQEDLNLLGRYKNNSIAQLFDEAITAGGKKLMDKMFQQPLSDPIAINQRSDTFRYFSELLLSFPFTAVEFAVMEDYLASDGGGNLLQMASGVIYKKILQGIANDSDFELLQSEVLKTIELLNRFYAFVSLLPKSNLAYRDQLERIEKIYAHPSLQWLRGKPEILVFSVSKIIRFDYLFRYVLREQMNELIELIFDLDVCIAVARIGIKKNFCYARAFGKEKNTMKVKRLFHPVLEHAIGNDSCLDQDHNVLFLTGANMAGKSTLMKSFGIGIYLAHMGFPVAADHMEFSVKDGLYTSINVPDNLDMGYSHFYAEVLRVKKVAEEVAASKNLVVIFDELFKGTNVKDAYDATLSITEAFSENRNCLFVISTHIVEVGEDLRGRCDHFKFAYLPTVMEGVVPRYTYKLTEGISQDRQGMIIIKNEGILDLIQS
ncbi:DNA mismatch repair protein [Pedobacter hiemivivus]|uniref:DNA mismatch repair protein n=1 Tax=Pedobacter hiemivivus TaxID=2530454 RepID=A0A4U1G0V7_9SPHI|nr:DNA mismatch repair protein [Pedobacter hiemivivus]TKC57115.1 DNA mismatch repair protein [Pedobacter hiemivivus]